MASVGGRTGLVTGANGGLGVAIVDLLLERGAARVYAAMRNIGNAPERWRDDTRISLLSLDVTRGDQIEDVAARASELDLVIHNAGINCIGPVGALSEEQARQVMEVNYYGPMRLTYAVAKELTRRRGGMIFILSIAAMIPPGPAPLYTASKSACANFAEGVLADFGKQGLDVALSFPGYIATPMAASYSTVQAAPRDIAVATLDGWESGQTHIFPDRFSTLVLEHLHADGARALTDIDGFRADLARAYDALI